MRRLVTVLLIVVVLAALWAGGWFAAASWAESRIGTVLAELAERGLDVDCGGRRIVGFPFALRLACGDTEIADRSSGSRARLSGLTGGVSVWSPMTASVAPASPVSVESPRIAAPASFEWREAEANIGMGLNGPRAVAFEAADLLAAVPVPNVGDTKVAAESASGRLAPTEEGGSDAAFSFTGLAVSAGEKTLPPFDGRGAAILSVPPRALLAGRAELQAPLSVREMTVTLSSGDARLQAAGDVSVDADGVLDGTITLRVAGAEDFPAFIAALPKEAQQPANMLVGGLYAVGKPAEIDGEEAREVTLTIERGEANVAGIPFTLPRLPLR